MGTFLESFLEPFELCDGGFLLGNSIKNLILVLFHLLKGVCCLVNSSFARCSRLRVHYRFGSLFGSFELGFHKI
jgi:hypothetical protein